MGRPKKEKPNHGNLYEIKITTGKTLDGELIRKSFYSPISKDDAKKQANEWKTEKELAGLTNSGFIERDITFTEWAERWLKTYKKGKVKEHTYNYTYRVNIENYMIPFFNNIKLRYITQSAIQEYFNQNNYLADNNLKRHRTILKNIFDKAIYNDLCIKNPVVDIKYSSIKDKNKRRAYTQVQAEKLTSYAKTHKCGEIIVLMLNTGVRRSELLGLKWEDFDKNNKSISVHRAIVPDTINPKDGEVKSQTSFRTIPISDKLTEYIDFLPRKTDFIIPGKTALGYLSIYGFDGRYRSFMEKASKELGIEYLTPHELRHTYGTVLREKGVDIYTISKVMGHSDISITAKIYVHNDMDVLRNNLKLNEKSPEK